MNCRDIIRKQLGISQTFQRTLMNTADWHNHAVSRLTSRQPIEFIQRKACSKVLIVMMNSEKYFYQHGRQDQHYPRAFAEFCGCKHYHDDGSTHRAESVDHHLISPTLLKSDR